MERETGRRSETYSLFDGRLTETEDRLRDSLVSLRARGAPARSHEVRVCVRVTRTHVVHTHDRDLREISTRFIIVLSVRPTLSESDGGPR